MLRATPPIQHRIQGAATSLLIASVAVVAVLVGLLMWNPFAPPVGGGELIVYCAAGVLPPVKEATEQFEKEVGIKVRFMHGNSGSLQVQIRNAHKGDVYIPADITFVQQLRDEGVAKEAISIAKFTLVLAVQPGNPKGITSLDDLLKEDINYGVATDPAAVGKKTKKLLTASGDWERIRDGAKVRKTTVRDVAQDVREGFTDAGFVWDATARQEGLEIIALPQLDSPKAVSNVTAGILSMSKRPAEALRFARYLAAPTKGQKAFAEQHYETVDGDPWAVTPKITVFAGGLNSVACKAIIDEFALREGVIINSQYDGCGALVGYMDKGQRPDAYFACDVSFTQKEFKESSGDDNANHVRDLFQEFKTVTKTRMVLLVPKGSTTIRTLEDLKKPDIKVGVAHETLSALGELTVLMLKDAGVYDTFITNGSGRGHTPTASALVLQLVDSGELDAAIVYEANCHHVKDRAQIVQIDHPLATALQPIAVSKGTEYPDLLARLIDTLTNEQSKKRFEDVGFEWKWSSSNGPAPKPAPKNGPESSGP